MKPPSPDILVVVPVLALLALAAVRSGRRPPRVGAGLAVVGAVFAGFLILRAAIPDENLWPNSEVARRTAWLQKHLTKTKDWDTRPVVILVGSSVTNYGVDPDLMERLLAEMGRPATVLSFCMPGDNHHERAYMLETFLRGLKPRDRERLARATVYYFGEVFDAYDTNPLYRLEKEAGTERAVMFLNPANALRAWTAYEHLLARDGTAPRWSMAWLLAEHALMNRFAVGAFSSMRPPPPRRKRTPPFFPLGGTKTTFHFEAAQEAFEKSAANAATDPVPPPPFQVCWTHLRRIMDPYCDRYGFYCLPTLEASRVEYAARFARSAPDGAPMIGPATDEDLRPLLREDSWFDGVHPTGTGAPFFTAWLARGIAAYLPEPTAP